MSRKNRYKSIAKREAVRLPLPGQSYEHEYDMRQRLVEQFKPDNLLEQAWLEDIAYCQSRIDYDRALITGFKMRCIKRAHDEQFCTDFDPDGEFTPALDTMTELWLSIYAQSNFIADEGKTYSADVIFASLLGQLSPRELGQFRLMQNMLHEEMQERDRIINQLHRSRRQAMRDAIEFAEYRSSLENQDPAELTGMAENKHLLTSSGADEPGGGLGSPLALTSGKELAVTTGPQRSAKSSSAAESDPADNPIIVCPQIKNQKDAA
ncbi:MAG: hypothetical protein EOP84_05545 [Verrucomicrobiaceae bacterium]|nr:MAG: hypothetical protein EOP84_05545 [Verrucomicrobiaceae bacterium]